MKAYTLLLVLMVGICVTGCPPQIDPVQQRETEEYVQEAQKNLETIEQLDAEEKYPQEYVTARDECVQAEKNLSSGQLDLAYRAAAKSLQVSRDVFKKLYIDMVARLAEDAKAEIERTASDDPDNPLQDFLPQLDEMLNYAEHLQQNDQLAVDSDMLLQALQDVTEIKRITRNTLQATLKSDISFAPGQYELSEAGQHTLRQFIQQIIARVSDNPDFNTNGVLQVNVKVIGYTDQVGFREGTDLVATLMKGLEDVAPDEKIEQRKFLNQRLSWFRAQNLSKHFTRIFLEEAQQLGMQVEFEEDVQGKGEMPPPGVSVVYSRSESISDPARRICKIYSYVMSQ